MPCLFEVESDFVLQDEDLRVAEELRDDETFRSMATDGWSDSDEWAALADSAHAAAIKEIHDRYVHSAPQLRRRFGHVALHGADSDAGSGGYAAAS